MKQSIYYVSNSHPLSMNKSGKEKYKLDHIERFNRCYAQLYTDLPVDNEKLRSKIVYIHHNIKNGNLPDVDNICKPLIDVFTGTIYVDDKLIVQREANRIDLDELEFITIEYTSMPFEVAYDLDQFISNRENHILLLSVSRIKLSDIKVGEI